MSLLKPTKGKCVILTIVLVFSFFLVHIVQAVTTEPGTDANPLVSQDYVDSKISELTAKIGVLTTQVNGLTAKNTELLATAGELASQIQVLQAQPMKFVIVQVKTGKQLIAGESAEIILRAGKATTVASANGGLSDLISGLEIKAGGNVPLNHLILVPRDDGRGIKAVNDLWVLVKGGYTIK